MIDRYDDPTDAIPHETTVLVLNETDRCFDRQPAALIDEVRSELACDKLMVEAHYEGLDDIPRYDRLVQYAVWVIHHSCLFTDRNAPLGSYLRTASFPDETQVLVVLDVEDRSTFDYMRREIEAEYSDEVVIVDSGTALVYYLLGHLQTANPCSAAGLDYIVSWNNKISDTIGPHQGAD